MSLSTLSSTANCLRHSSVLWVWVKAFGLSLHPILAHTRVWGVPLHMVVVIQGPLYVFFLPYWLLQLLVEGRLGGRGRAWADHVAWFSLLWLDE